jgi:hypothetical protein
MNFWLKVIWLQEKSMASNGLSVAEFIAGTVATHHAAAVAAAANHTPHQTVVTTATAHLATADAAVANRKTRQTVATAPTATSATRLSSTEAAAENIGSRMPSRSVSNNNQPARTPWPYMADLPVDVRHLLMKVPETELGDCP